MAELTDLQLTDLSNTVQNETAAGANTATRIGELFNDIVDSKINNDKISTDMVADSGSNSKVPSVAAVETQLSGKQNSLGFTAENVANKSTNITMDTGSNTKYPTVAAVESYVSGNTLPYKVYVATLSQSGTSAPSPIVLQNTLGGTVVWTRTGTGNYVATLNGVFTSNKTVAFVNTSINDTQLQSYRVDNDQVRLDQQNLSNVSTDGLYGNCIEIRVYNS